MKHAFTSFRLILLVGLAACVAVSAAAQQSLGDAARKARQNRPPEPTTRVITNDDIATGSSVRAAEPGSPAPAASSSDEASKSSSEAKTGDDAKKEKDSSDDQAKLDKGWQEKIAAQKDQISLLERELDVLQRENKLRATNYYADAGARLRDEKKYAEDDRKYRDQVADKQKQIDDAKTKLEQTKDDARKAGASPSVIG